MHGRCGLLGQGGLREAADGICLMDKCALELAWVWLSCSGMLAGAYKAQGPSSRLLATAVNA